MTIQWAHKDTAGVLWEHRGCCEESRVGKQNTATALKYITYTATYTTYTATGEVLLSCPGSNFTVQIRP